MTEVYQTIPVNGKQYELLGSTGKPDSTKIKHFRDPETGAEYLEVDSVGGNGPTYYRVFGQEIEKTSL